MSTPRDSEPVSRRSRPAKPPLTRTGIVEAAIGILDTDGLDRLTMRKLATALDTAAGSLYVYFANRDELLADVYDHVLGELRLPDLDAPTAEWDTELIDLLLHAITVIGEHGGIADAALGAIPTGPNSLAFTEVLLGLLARGGVDDQAAAWAVDQLSLYVNAAALEHSAHLRRGDQEESVIAGLRATFAELPAQRYPHTHRLRDALVTGDGDERARWLLTTLLKGLTSPRE
ncbi:TetR/AcrR family transcriptional regulator [Pseudonocardia spinosispora]|uniref:TetR/AcrR family transcriptional regulator n=1 Tax=Pseudonocardia spinosispora TaxID=103441 RepID=UPI000403FFFA|nr:TetR/AcrR family transcriptional regulator [Pseudonocardia spinosispora]